MMTVDVQKMRNARDRIAERERRHERADWLASLTPEHRAVHERGLGPLCEPCLTAAMQRAGRVAAAALRRPPFSAGGVMP